MGFFRKSTADRIRELEDQQELRQKFIRDKSKRLKQIENSADDAKERDEILHDIGHAESEIEAFAKRIEKLTK